MELMVVYRDANLDWFKGYFSGDRVAKTSWHSDTGRRDTFLLYLKGIC